MSVADRLDKTEISFLGFHSHTRFVILQRGARAVIGCSVGVVCTLVVAGRRIWITERCPCGAGLDRADLGKVADCAAVRKSCGDHYALTCAGGNTAGKRPDASRIVVGAATRVRSVSQSRRQPVRHLHVRCIRAAGVGHGQREVDRPVQLRKESTGALAQLEIGLAFDEIGAHVAQRVAGGEAGEACYAEFAGGGDRGGGRQCDGNLVLAVTGTIGIADITVTDRRAFLHGIGCGQQSGENVVAVCIGGGGRQCAGAGGILEGNRDA